VTDSEFAAASSPAQTGAGGQPSTRAEDGNLAERLRDGDRQAMAEIFSVHLDVIYNYCYRRTGAWSVAEDLASTVFLEVWKARQRAIEINGSLLPWVYGVATNVCRNYSRSQRRSNSALARQHLTDLAVQNFDDEVVGQLADTQRLRRLLARIAELPQRDQDVFFLVGWEGLSYAETAEALGIAIGTVRSRLARVRRILRITELQEHFDV
jgi:RNA polymerase sigma factor (sigma-70 family)